jgi:hypothetical protein
MQNRKSTPVNRYLVIAPIVGLTVVALVLFVVRRKGKS